MDETGRPTEGDPGPAALATRADFAAAVRRVVATAATRGSRRLVFVDADLSDWPLDEPELLATLGAWLLRPGRQLVLLADDFEALPRSHPRFVAWRRDWVHAIEACTPAEPGTVTLPTLLLDEGQVCVRVIDKRQWRGAVTCDARELWQARERVDAILQRSVPAFPATTVGL